MELDCGVCILSNLEDQPVKPALTVIEGWAVCEDHTGVPFVSKERLHEVVRLGREMYDEAGH